MWYLNVKKDAITMHKYGTGSTIKTHYGCGRPNSDLTSNRNNNH